MDGQSDYFRLISTRREAKPSESFVPPLKVPSPRISIVDDSPTIRYGLKKNLAQIGAIVTEASDGDEGLSIMNSQDFDLIITDIEASRMNGFAFCSKLKSHFTKNSSSRYQSVELPERKEH